jgi:hypothetical protein
MKNYQKKKRINKNLKQLFVFILLSCIFFVACQSDKKTEKSEVSAVTVIKCEKQDCKAPLCEEIDGLETNGTPKQVPKDYNGPIKVCSNNGRLFTYYHVLNGKIDGEMLLYDKNGILGQRSNFKKGKQEGISTTYDSEGTLIKTETFLDGKKIHCEGNCDD